MKYRLKFALILALSSLLGSCGDQEINTEFSVTTEPVFVIPAKAVSCYSVKTTGFGQTPAQDVEGSYFKIPSFSFTRQNSDKNLIISVIKISYSIPGATAGSDSAGGSCIFDGDQLRALSSVWWASTTAEAVIERGTGTPNKPFKTDCPAYCGGISTDLPQFSATATIEIFGLERDTVTQNETPVRIQGFVNIQSL